MKKDPKKVRISSNFVYFDNRLLLSDKIDSFFILLNGRGESIPPVESGWEADVLGRPRGQGPEEGSSLF